MLFESINAKTKQMRHACTERALVGMYQWQHAVAVLRDVVKELRQIDCYSKNTWLVLNVGDDT